MSFAITEEDYAKENIEHLRSEFGWKEVESGLGRILLGYSALIGGLLLCFGLVGISVYYMLKYPTTASNPNLGYLWLFYLGLGLTGLVCPIAYVIILMGKVRCALSAPERHGARWLIFACLTCILMGPALNVGACVTGMKERPDIRRGPGGFARIRFSKTGLGMQVASSIIGLASLLFFVLFLRAVGQCFLDRGRILLVNSYLFFLMLLVAGILYVALADRKLLFKPAVVLGLGGGLVLGFFWYLFLVATFRTCISNGLAQIRPPLEAE
jgi:hypothetical protein